MKKIVEFDDTPEDRDQYLIFSSAHKYRRALEEFREALRQVCKYGEPNETDNKWREKFHEILIENEVEL
jgi:hypothetical protein